MAEPTKDELAQQAKDKADRQAAALAAAADPVNGNGAAPTSEPGPGVNSSWVVELATVEAMIEREAKLTRGLVTAALAAALIALLISGQARKAALQALADLNPAEA